MAGKKSKKNKAVTGRPVTKVDLRILKGLASIACTYPEISLILGVEENTLRAHYGHIIEKGMAEGNRSLRRRQHELAMMGNTRLLVWLGKNRLGQKEQVNMVHSVDDSLAKLSNEELEKELKKYKELTAFADNARRLKAVPEIKEVVEIGPAAKEGSREGNQA